MPNRIIKAKSRNSTVQLLDCMSSLFALELLSPSHTLYLISPWLSNVALLDNSFSQLRSVAPESDRGDVTLADLLGTLAERGTRVRIICRHSPSTEEFLARLPSGIERRYLDRMHEKGLVGDHFYLRGSMNFTYSGVNLNDEHVELTTEPEQVALALAEAKATWEGIEQECA